MIKPDVQAVDDETHKGRNIKAELEYCGMYIRHRKNITDQDLRIYAGLLLASLRRVRELKGGK